MKKRLVIVIILFSTLLTACSGGLSINPAAGTVQAQDVQPIESTPAAVTAEGRLLPSRSAELSFVQAGVIQEVLVQPGEKAGAGQVLARLVGKETIQAELAAGMYEQTMAQQSLDALKRAALLNQAATSKTQNDAQKAYESESNGWRVANKDNATDLELALDEYISAEKDYRAAREKLDNLLYKETANRERKEAQADVERELQALAESYTGLLDAAAANEQTLDEKTTRLLSAIASLEMARDTRDRLGDDNLDPEKLAAAEARLKAAAEHVAAAQAALANLELRAPFAGVILSMEGLVLGETALPGTPVVFLADTAVWQVETKDLAEIDIARVAAGQSATIKLDALPGEEFRAIVTAIDPVGREYLGDMTYKVVLALDQPDPRFLWNMTATISIDVEPEF